MNKKHIKGIVLLGLLASIGLPSCHVFNKYQAPETDVIGLYRDVDTSDTTTIASISWKDYFNDPLLQALIDESLNNNFDMQIIMQRVNQAEAALGMARAAYFPTLSIAGQATHTRLSMNTDANSSNTGKKDFLGYSTNEYRLGLATSWELDIWGKLNKQSKAKYAQYLNSIEGKNLVQSNLVSAVATMYYTLLSLDEQLKISKEAILLLNETVETMQSMKEAGYMNGAAVEQTKAALYSTELNIPNLEKAIRELENNICATVGRKPQPVLRSSFSQQVAAKKLAIGTPAQMLANRPDVRSAELDFRSAFQLTNAARANFYPSITLSSGMLGFVSLVDNFFDPKNLALSLIGNVAQPIFARKQLSTQLKVAKADQEIALLSFKKTVLNAGVEVSNIIMTYETVQKKEILREKQIESLTKAVEYTQLLLKAGEVSSYLEVINAEQDLLQARLGKVSDKLEQLQCGVDLYKALGGSVK